MTQATRPLRICTVRGCDRAARAKGYCPAHYRRWKDHGDPGSAEIGPAHRKSLFGPACIVEGCERRAEARGYCGTHATRLRRRGTLEVPLRVPLIAKCSIDGCEYVGRLRRGWCPIHYERWHKHGDPLYKRPSVEERFWAKVDKNGPIPEHRPELGPCWLWHRGNKHGYAVFTIGKKSIPVHRFAYELEVGFIPDKFQIDHLCHHPELCELAEQCPHRRCVNPAHLEAVTCKENLMRSGSIQAWHAARTRRREGRESAPERVVYRKGRRYRASMVGWPPIEDEPDKVA